jgi:hypothetical protein
MAKERKPHLIRVRVELEDNCGSILVKTEKTIPVKNGKARKDHEIADLFAQFVVEELPESFTL